MLRKFLYRSDYVKGTEPIHGFVATTKGFNDVSSGNGGDDGGNGGNLLIDRARRRKQMEVLDEINNLRSQGINARPDLTEDHLPGIPLWYTGPTNAYGRVPGAHKGETSIDTTNLPMENIEIQQPLQKEPGALPQSSAIVRWGSDRNPLIQIIGSSQDNVGAGTGPSTTIVTPKPPSGGFRALKGAENAGNAVPSLDNSDDADNTDDVTPLRRPSAMAADEFSRIDVSNITEGNIDNVSLNQGNTDNVRVDDPQMATYIQEQQRLNPGQRNMATDVSLDLLKHRKRIL